MNPHALHRIVKSPGLAAVAVLSLGLAVGAPAGEPATAPSVMPALAEFARSRDIPIEGIEFAREGSPPRAGDRVTLILTHTRNEVRRQWLAVLEADELSPAEQRLRPAPELIYHTSTGRELHYVTTRTALRVYFAGPFLPDAAPERAQLDAAMTRPERVLVSPEHLRRGLEEYCRLGLPMARRLEAAGIKNLYHLGSDRPLSREKLAKGKPFAAFFTADDEQATFGGYFALMSFLQAARKVDAFDEMLTQTMARPSAWSVIARLGLVNMVLNYDCRDIRVGPGERAAAAAPVYQLPVKLRMNGRLALKATLTATAPRAPLQTCAGIVGIQAEHPDDPGTRLDIRVVAARPAAARGS